MRYFGCFKLIRKTDLHFCDLLFFLPFLLRFPLVLFFCLSNCSTNFSSSSSPSSSSSCSCSCSSADPPSFIYIIIFFLSSPFELSFRSSFIFFFCSPYIFVLLFVFIILVHVFVSFSTSCTFSSSSDLSSLLSTTVFLCLWL